MATLASEGDRELRADNDRPIDTGSAATERIQTLGSLFTNAHWKNLDDFSAVVGYYVYSVRAFELSIWHIVGLGDVIQN